MTIEPWVNDDQGIHCVEFSFIGPKVVQADSSKSISDILKVDAKKLAKKILDHLQSRSNISEVSLVSDYATITFSTITAESVWGSLGFKSGDFQRLSKPTLEIVTNLNTGKETIKKQGNYMEKVLKSQNVIFTTEYVASYYRACYLAHISSDFITKNPASYIEIQRQLNGFDNIPYLAAKLVEGITGSISETGFISNNLLPIPSTKLGFNVPNIGNLFDAFFSTYSTERQIRSVLDVPADADLSQPISILNELNTVYYNGGIPRLFGINNGNEVVQISERLLGYLTGHRSDLLWIFSSLARLFEYNGAVEMSSINKNLRFFQDNLKKLIDSSISPVLYPDGSPRTLTDLCIDWFGDNGAKIASLLESLDPLRKSFQVERVSGSEVSFQRIKSRLERVSPGLILLNPDLYQAASISNNEILLTFTDRAKDVVVKVILVGNQINDQYSIDSFISVFNGSEEILNKIIDDLNGLLVITLWLSNGDSSKGFAVNKDSGLISINWPGHVLRRYSKLPIYKGTVKVWLAEVK